MLNIYFTKDSGQGMWLNLPVSATELEEAHVALNAITPAHSAIRIGDADSSVHSLPQFLKKVVVTDQILKELDFLARRTEAMSDQELEIMGAALEIENPYSIMEIVNLSCNLDKFDYFPEITNEVLLGKFLIDRDRGKIPERVAALLDFEIMGHQYALSHAGCFGATGYTVRNGRALEPMYDGKILPDPCYEKNSLFVLSIQRNGQFVDLYLPVPESKLDMMEKNLGVSCLEDCGGMYMKENVEGLKTRVPCGASVKEINRFAARLKDHVFDGSETTRKLLLAALEAEAPATIKAAIDIAENLQHYTLLEEDSVKTPVDYAHHVLKEAGIQIEEELEAFMDYEGFGRYRIKKDGAVATTFGFVRREESLIALLPEETTALRLFSPLTAVLDYEWEDCGGRPQTLDGYELCEYQTEIREGVERDNQCLESESGLAEYLNNQILKRKIASMIPSVDIWDDQLWGVLEVQVRGELSDGEMKELFSEWAGQCSDGWGEGFEQHPINIQGKELYVSFWDLENDYFIKTEQELKGQPIQTHEMQMGGM